MRQARATTSRPSAVTLASTSSTRFPGCSASTVTSTSPGNRYEKIRREPSHGQCRAAALISWTSRADGGPPPRMEAACRALSTARVRSKPSRALPTERRTTHRRPRSSPRAGDGHRPRPVEELVRSTPAEKARPAPSGGDRACTRRFARARQWSSSMRTFDVVLPRSSVRGEAPGQRKRSWRARLRRSRRARQRPCRRRRTCRR